MDHPSDLPAPQPWRNAAFIAACVATVELAVILIVGIILFGKYFSGEVDKATDPVTVAKAAVQRDQASAATQESSGKPAAKPLLPVRQTSVLILNGNGIGGAAAVAAERIRGKHYLVAGTGNAPRTDFRRSVVMYRPGFEGEAKRLAHQIGVHRVTPLDGLRARELSGAHVALIIGG
jgi:hypothetical protein